MKICKRIKIFIYSNKVSLTLSSVFPNKFKPFHCLGSLDLSSVLLNPIPQILSYGLASTKFLPAVDSNSVFIF